VTSSAERGLALLAALVALVPPPAAAQDAALAARVRRLVAAAWQLDPAAVRVELPAEAPPVADTAGLRLAGTGGDGWFALVIGRGARAGALRIRAAHVEQLPVAARALPSGLALADADIRWEERPRYGPPRAAHEQVRAGWTTRRPFPEGAALVAPGVAPAAAVAAGAPVAVEWTSGAVRVSLAGTALGAAGLGQPVRVQLIGRPGLRQGIVVAPGLVRLPS